MIDFYNDYTPFYEVTFGPRVMFVFNDALDYSDNSTRDQVFSQIDRFRDDEYFLSDDDYMESWFHSFEKSLTSDPASLTEYIEQLEVFLVEYPRFSLDVNINSAKNQITSSRILIQSRGIRSTNDERDIMLRSRHLADQSPFDITPYHPGFIYFDQFVVIARNTIQNLLIAIACMLFIAFLLIPSIAAVIWTAISVASICFGVIGFMVHWDVSLDSVSMINLVMCIGFSVDFAAHISYHFAISKSQTGDTKAIDALHHLGTPILYSALSTILGVSVLASSDTYIFRTFFKLIFLVMVFGFFHAMFVLPVVLSLFHCKSKNSYPVSSPQQPTTNLGRDNPALESEKQAGHNELHVGKTGN